MQRSNWGVIITQREGYSRGQAPLMYVGAGKGCVFTSRSPMEVQSRFSILESLDDNAVLLDNALPKYSGISSMVHP